MYSTNRERLLCYKVLRSAKKVIAYSYIIINDGMESLELVVQIKNLFSILLNEYEYIVYVDIEYTSFYIGGDIVQQY